MDKYNFYGNSLHVCYVPEYESLNDLREKLHERRNIVDIKCKKYGMILKLTKLIKNLNSLINRINEFRYISK